MKKFTTLMLCIILLFSTNLLFADDGFDSLFTDIAEGGNSSALEITGLSNLEIYASLNSSKTVLTNYNLNLNLAYEGTNSNFNGKIKLNTLTLESNPLNIIDELNYTFYSDNFVIQAGKTKLVWGRGDKLHVLDSFNANDYSLFILPDYLDRRVALPMLSVSYNSLSSLSLQAVWTPSMTADILPLEGAWTIDEASSLYALCEGYVKTQAKNAYASTYSSTLSSLMAAGLTQEMANPTALLAANEASLEIVNQYSDEEAFLPDTSTLDYGQYGLRLTGTVGSFDLGAQYYLGHYKTPSVEYQLAQDVYGNTEVNNLSLSYDKLSIFGLDGEKVIGAFNLRGELAYYMTEDTEGSNPSIHNPSLQYLLGCDVSLPFNELDLNVQVIGSYTLFNDKIVSPLDIEYEEDRNALSNKVVAQLSDSWKNETIKTKIAGIWNIEKGDVVVMPTVDYVFDDSFTISLTGALIYELKENGEFSEFEDTDFIKLKTSYSF